MGVHAVEEHPAEHRPAQVAQGPAHEDVVDVADVLVDVGGQVGEGGPQHRDAHPLQGTVKGVKRRGRRGRGRRCGEAPARSPHSPAPGRPRTAPRRCSTAARLPPRPGRIASRRRRPPPPPPAARRGGAAPPPLPPPPPERRTGRASSARRRPWLLAPRRRRHQRPLRPAGPPAPPPRTAARGGGAGTTFPGVLRAAGGPAHGRCRGDGSVGKMAAGRHSSAQVLPCFEEFFQRLPPPAGCLGLVLLGQLAPELAHCKQLQRCAVTASVIILIIIKCALVKPDWWLYAGLAEQNYNNQVFQ